MHIKLVVERSKSIIDHGNNTFTNTILYIDPTKHSLISSLSFISSCISI